jgi:hypothetical protein
LKVNTTTGPINLTGTITGGDQAEIYGAGDVTINGTVTMAKALRIHSTGGRISLTGTVSGGDHVEAFAQKDVAINATMTAKLSLRIHSDNGFTSLQGTYTSGDAMEMMGKTGIAFNGTASSTASTILINSPNGNVTLHGRVTASSDLNINSGPGYSSDAVLASLRGRVKVTLHS